MDGIQVDQVEILDPPNSKVEILDPPNAGGHSEAEIQDIQAQVTSAPSTVDHTPSPQLSGTEDPMSEVCPSIDTGNIESSTRQYVLPSRSTRG